MIDTELQSDRLSLRLVDREDEALFVALYTEPQIMARIGPVLTQAQALDTLQRAIAANQAAHPGHRFWSICESDGTQLGVGSLVRRGSVAEMGLMLLPAAWDGVVSVHAIRALFEFAASCPGISHVEGESRIGVNARVARRLLAPHGFYEVTPGRPGCRRWRSVVVSPSEPAAAPVGSRPARR